MSATARRLYLLPFDHRENFARALFGWEGTLSAGRTAEIAASEHVISNGFQAAVASGVPKAHAAILMDERFGAEILRDAASKGYVTARPAERSGQKEFVFEFGDDFARHIEAMNPRFCKVLVRYNPEGDAALNRRQAVRLKRLSDYLHGSDRLFMFELLVPPEPTQLEQLHGNTHAYDRKLRPRLMVQAVGELQECGHRAGRLEGRRHGPARRLCRLRRGGAPGRPRESALHHLRPWRGRSHPCARVARDGGQRVGVCRIRGGPHDVLGCAG